MERQFDQQLEKLRTKLIKMCSLVDEQLDYAIRAVLEENFDLAEMVIQRDKKVDKYDLKIDKLCQKIVALHQPVAMDLRLIMSALTINNNLERIGDSAVNIAEGFLELKKKPAYFDRTPFESMGNIAKEMLKNAIDSLIGKDPKLAEKVIKMDDELDNLDKKSYEVLVKIMKEDSANIDSALILILISKQLERIGDHATNIAEDIFFIVEAHLIKYKYEKFLYGDEEEDDDEKEIDDKKEGTT